MRIQTKTMRNHADADEDRNTAHVIFVFIPIMIKQKTTYIYVLYKYDKTFVKYRTWTGLTFH